MSFFLLVIALMVEACIYNFFLKNKPLHPPLATQTFEKIAVDVNPSISSQLRIFSGRLELLLKFYGSARHGFSQKLAH